MLLYYPLSKSKIVPTKTSMYLFILLHSIHKVFFNTFPTKNSIKSIHFATLYANAKEM